jgi:hypothetical protein
MHKIRNRVRFPDQANRQSNAKRALKAMHQLRPTEAVDAQVLLESARQGYPTSSGMLRVQLARKFADDGQQSFLAGARIGDRLFDRLSNRIHEQFLALCIDSTLIRIKSTRGNSSIELPPIGPQPVPAARLIARSAGSCA